MKNKKLTLTELESARLVERAVVGNRVESIFRKQIRNRLMMLLMLDAGLRVAEVAQIERSSLLFAGHFCESVTVTAEAAKNHRQRTIPSSKRLKETILDMSELVWVPDGCPGDGFCFYKNNYTKPLAIRQIQRIIKRMSLDNIGRAINPHLLRHTFATRLMRTVNIRVVQELLGHVSITSTQVYTHPNGDDLKKAIDSMDA